MTHGDLLLSAASAANREVLLVAPFAKAVVIERILGVLPIGVPVSIYTRWRPLEVASGVSDLEVFDLAERRSHTALYLCDTLHAKYYRCDDCVLLGSANLTQKGLGWAAQSNLELLIEVPWSTELSRDFERRLSRESIPANRELQSLVRVAALALPQQQQPETTVSQATASSIADDEWLPLTRRPEVLFRAYVGEHAELTTALWGQASTDLARLRIPGSLDKTTFLLMVRASLLQRPIVVAIDSFVRTPRRFGEVRELLSKHLKEVASTRDPTEAWQTTLRWLMYFFPDRYRVVAGTFSEVISHRTGEDLPPRTRRTSDT